MEITVRESKDEKARRITVYFDFGKGVGDLVKLFGPDVVFHAAEDALTRDIREFVRPRLIAGDSDESIREAVANFKPGKRASNPKVAQVFKMLGKCSASDLEQLQAMLGGQLPSTN